MTRLYIFFVTLFSTVVIVSNFITPKLLEYGGLAIPAGLITYPLTFFISDCVTEVYGVKQARFMIWLGFAMSLTAALIVRFALILPPQQLAFWEVFGQNPTIVTASVLAYLVSQYADVTLYALIKKLTGEKWLWLRSNGSTLISQALDTTIVTSLTFLWGFGYEWAAVLPLIIASYLYKAVFSVSMTPIYYLVIHFIKRKATPHELSI